MAPAKTLEHAVRYWPYAMGALDDGKPPIDNNLTERSIKPFGYRQQFCANSASRRHGYSLSRDASR